MPRKNRGYKKGEPFRDARLFVIACEGEKREKEYFEALVEGQRRIKVKLLSPSYEEKGGYDRNSFIPFVSDAIDRAAATDNNPTHHLPPAMSTKVYRLAEEIRAWLE